MSPRSHPEDPVREDGESDHPADRRLSEGFEDRPWPITFMRSGESPCIGGGPGGQRTVSATAVRTIGG